MNQLKTVLLLGGLTGLLMALGYALGGQVGILVGFIISAVMNLVSYWYSDKIVLSMYGAKEIQEQDDPKLFRIVSGLAQDAGLPMPRLYLVDMPVPNAFATGRNPEHAAVAVSPSIMSLLTERELRAVLAHELSHITNRDILISSVAATLAGAISFLAQLAYFIPIGSSDNRDGPSFAETLAILILTPIMAMLIQLAISRSREYQADASGAKLSHDPDQLASALRKIDSYSTSHPIQPSPGESASAHLFIINPFKASVLSSFLSTHPPTEERIKRLEAMQV